MKVMSCERCQSRALNPDHTADESVDRHQQGQLTPVLAQPELDHTLGLKSGRRDVQAIAQRLAPASSSLVSSGSSPRSLSSRILEWLGGAGGIRAKIASTKASPPSPQSGAVSTISAPCDPTT